MRRRRARPSADRFRVRRRDTVQIERARHPRFQHETRKKAIGHGHEARLGNVDVVEGRRDFVEPGERCSRCEARKVVSGQFSAGETADDVIDQQTIEI